MMETFFGSVSHHLAVLATSLDRYTAAEELFAEALAMHERLRARPLIARTQHEWAAMLLRRGEAGDLQRALPLLDAIMGDPILAQRAKGEPPDRWHVEWVFDDVSEARTMIKGGDALEAARGTSADEMAASEKWLGDCLYAASGERDSATAERKQASCMRQYQARVAASNEAFDASLRARNPEWGLRDLDAVVAEAEGHGFALESVTPMPANNLSVVLRKV